ncbi:hypothetical protein [Leifsonia aquatica]|uniref:hypothetical protein n=1 Tax=Leifsonia aquatica TaxID=144185 RepID=UPI00046A7A87|nr:hypothetical protein [Leifsonia aquatica]
MRVRTPVAKAGLIVAGYAGVVLAVIPVAVSTTAAWGVATGSGIVLLLVLALTRVFRGENESDAPRAWWRMTARPAAGYVLGLGFALQAVGATASAAPESAPAAWIGCLVSLVIAAAYLNSAVRLGAGAPDRPATDG